jgi:UDP-N-acetyl-D-glucosamine dehydrogenase
MNGNLSGRRLNAETEAPSAALANSQTSSVTRLDHSKYVEAGVVGLAVDDSRYRRDVSSSRIAVVGMGYVGLPTALSFADRGAEVIGVDVNETRLAAIKDARVDLLPRDLSRLKGALKSDLLHLTTESSALAPADAVVICVPTPLDAHLTPDLTALTEACEAVVKYAPRGQIIVLTSTTYPGCTNDLVVKPLEAKGFRVGADVFVAFSPERIDPGVSDHAPEHTPRVVGGHTRACAERAAGFLAHTAGRLHLVSSPKVAEMTKLLENTFRAVNIALANEFADAARELGLDAMEVIEAAATKPYGFMPFYPGAGVGGHCIPCDPHYLLWELRALRASSPVVDAAMTAIAARPREVVAQARRILGDRGKSVRGARILIAGVSYKPGVSDVRESPAIPIIDMLASEGAHVAYTDSHIGTLQTPAAGRLSHLPSPGGHQWDLVVVHTVHPDQDYGWLSSQPAVLDTSYRLTDLPDRHVL